MDYFLLNINTKGKNCVEEWIEKKNIAPIFFGHSTIDEIINKEKSLPSDAYLFINTFYNINKNAIIISISDKNLYVYRQAEEVKECPLILSTIKSNRYMSAGTFRKIQEQKGTSYFGNIKAIEYLLNNEKPKINSFEDYLFCLSSIEFETLLAKMYEGNGYYVPAYKGGFIKNFDLFCRKGTENLSIQIKLNLTNKQYNKYTDLFYCINSEREEDNIRTWKDIKHEIKKCNETKVWLEKTLKWVNYNEEI
jgi:hypothetical protein